MTMTRICKKKEIQRISIFFFILLQGYPKSVLEGHCPAEFSSNLPQHTCLEVSSIPNKILIGLFRCLIGDGAELCRTVALQEQDWAPALVHILYSSITVCNINKQALLSGTVKRNQSQSQKSQSQLYFQFCHMYRTYIQRIEIALLSYSLVHTDNTKH